MYLVIGVWYLVFGMAYFVFGLMYFAFGMPYFIKFAFLLVRRVLALSLHSHSSMSQGDFQRLNPFNVV